MMTENISNDCSDGVNVKLELVNKIEASADEVVRVVWIPEHDGILSVSNDRSVRVWLLRDSGQYWPTICHYFEANPNALTYNHDQKKLFIGLETGLISEFEISDDFNRMDHRRDYMAHLCRVTDICFSSFNSWLLSTSRDRYFQLHCTGSGRRLGGYMCGAWCSSLAFDHSAGYAFVGDISGHVTVLKIIPGHQTQSAGVSLVNVLKGQNGSIQVLCWDVINGWLYSGGQDGSIFIWDIGGRKGNVYELYGHKEKITALVYLSDFKKLVSVSEDSTLVIWNMNVPRIETANWSENDTCELCRRPFFWNWRAMYDQKQIGLRQHHCRKCGKAVCDTCSTKRSSLPICGYEIPVRVCEKCFIGITQDDRKSLAEFVSIKNCIKFIDLDVKKSRMISIGGRGGEASNIKIWNVLNSPFIAYDDGHRRRRRRRQL